MTDNTLWALLLHEPQQGFPELTRQYGGYVYTIVRSKLSDIGTVQDIEEAVSDVFVLFWQWLQKHPDTQINLRALLAVMAKRHAINRFYALTRQAACISIDDLLELPQDAADTDQSVVLMETVRSLGEPDSEIILRRFYFGQTSKEIGNALKLQPNTVDQKISRGLRKLRTIWKEG